MDTLTIAGRPAASTRSQTEVVSIVVLAARSSSTSVMFISCKLLQKRLLAYMHNMNSKWNTSVAKQ
jgi:hypothetical protein